MAQGAPLQSELCVFPEYREWLPVAGRRGKIHARADCLWRGKQASPQASGNTLVADERCLANANWAAPEVTADITNQLRCHFPQSPGSFPTTQQRILGSQ